MGLKMTILRIKPDNTFEINVTIDLPDEFSKKIHVKFEHHLIPEDYRGCNELFLTVDELDKLGRFLLRQADEIRVLHHRESNGHK